MARLSFAFAAAAVVVGTATVAGVATATALPPSVAREEAALAESVRESWLIVLSKSCDAACMEGVRARLAARCDAVRLLPNIHMLSTRCAETPDAAAAGPPPPSVEDLLAGLPEVEATVPDAVVSVPEAATAGGAAAAAAPTTARQSGRTFWGLDRINQFSLPLDGDSSVERCYPGRGAGVTVYVIDTGCTTDHPQFEGRATTKAGPGSPFRSGDDDNSHGSHVAGTVGGRDTGVARGVTIKCIKVLNRRAVGSMTDIAAAFDAVTGAKVADPSARIILSASLGGPSRPGRPGMSGVAARRASEAGVVVIVAAGNDGGDACAVSPASEPSLITVANAARDDSLARSSNRGRCVDVIAPGTRILSVDGFSPSGGLKTLSGTSMATPHVAGVAALIMGEDPNGGRLTTADVQARMIAAAPQVGGYPMSYAGGDCSGGGPGASPALRPTPVSTPAPIQEPTPAPTPTSPGLKDPEDCTPVWRRVCPKTSRWWQEECSVMIVCAETGLPW